MTGRYLKHCSSPTLTKHCGLNCQSVTESTFRGREETPAVLGTPAIEDSQPIPVIGSDVEVQLAKKGPSNLTTALGGLSSTKQEELTACPESKQSVLELTAMCNTLF